MQRKLPIVGAALSLVIMLLVAMKWKIPRQPALAGTTTATLIAAISFFRIYRLCKTGWAMAAGVLGQVGLALACALALVMQRFWRDPDRVPPREKGVVLSAADGEVLYIKTVDENSTPLVTKNGRDYLLTELMGTNLMAVGAYIIGVEMNVLNVHVNRCPIDGQVKLVKHIGGKFISLRKEEAPFVNERCTTVIENSSLVVGVVQVASRLVRRIENYLHMNQAVSLGQRLGMIRFGSLVAVVLPKRSDVRIGVKVGDRVTAGVSILARYAADGGSVET